MTLFSSFFFLRNHVLLLLKLVKSKILRDSINHNFDNSLAMTVELSPHVCYFQYNHCGVSHSSVKYPVILYNTQSPIHSTICSLTTTLTHFLHWDRSQIDQTIFYSVYSIIYEGNDVRRYVHNNLKRVWWWPHICFHLFIIETFPLNDNSHCY